MYSNAYALHDRFNANVKKVIHGIIEFKKDNEIDCLVARGLSGVKIASAVSFHLDIPLAIVRKDESTHSCYKIEADENFGKHKNFVIIDDFICSGDTINAIIENINTDWRREHVGYPAYNISCMLYEAWDEARILSEKYADRLKTVIVLERAR